MSARELDSRGLLLGGFNCLGLARVLPKRAREVREFVFPGDDGESICCTVGPLADCLMVRIEAGASSLQDALGRWLLPRHAARFQAAVEAGKLLLWVRLGSAEHERIVCQCLLASSSDPVGVHEFAGVPNRGDDEAAGL